jgi:hypothetical protein
MGGGDKRRRSPGSLTFARNFFVLISCFLLGLFSIRLLKGRVLTGSTLLHLSPEGSLRRCQTLSLASGNCNCTADSAGTSPPPVPSSNPKPLVQNPDGKAEGTGVLAEKSLQPLEDVLLFVGILSGRGYRHRRLAVRESWANKCQVAGVSVCRFILSQDEETPQVCKGSC